MSPSGRRKKKAESAALETWRAFLGMVYEGVLLVAALGIMWGVNWVAHQVVGSFSLESQRLSHGVLIVTDLMTFLTIVLPKALRFVNEVVGLGVTICVTIAAGTHRIRVAFRTGERQEP